jgi:hypothetical protein
MMRRFEEVAEVLGMSGFSWADLDHLWLAPAVLGLVIVAAVLLYALWRNHRSQRPPSGLARRPGSVSADPSYAGSKPARPDDPLVSTDPAGLETERPRRRVP